MAVYRLLMPVRTMDWAQAILQGLFYSAVNYVLLLPLVVFVHRGGYLELHPLRYWAAVLVMVLVAPMCWPLLLARAFDSHRLSSRLQLPFPTIWDYVFRRNRPAFVLVRLNDGRFVGGFWGPGSKAGTHPNDGDLFISAAYAVDENGKFLAALPRTAGLHVRKEQYAYVQFFTEPTDEAPAQEGGGHVDVDQKPAQARE